MKENGLPDITPKEVDFAARIFCLALIDSGADELTITQEGFRGGGKNFGDFKIVASRTSNERS